LCRLTNTEELMRKNADHITGRDRNRAEPDRKNRDSGQQECPTDQKSRGGHGNVIAGLIA
jgi:hypothetical protein